MSGFFAIGRNRLRVAGLKVFQASDVGLRDRESPANSGVALDYKKDSATIRTHV